MVRRRPAPRCLQGGARWGPGATAWSQETQCQQLQSTAHTSCCRCMGEPPAGEGGGQQKADRAEGTHQGAGRRWHTPQHAGKHWSGWPWTLAAVTAEQSLPPSGVVRRQHDQQQETRGGGAGGRGWAGASSHMHTTAVALVSAPSAVSAGAVPYLVGFSKQAGHLEQDEGEKRPACHPLRAGGVGSLYPRHGLVL